MYATAQYSWITVVASTRCERPTISLTSNTRNSDVHPSPSCHNMTLPALCSGAGGSYRSISADRVRTAANQLHVAAAVDRRDRQTDGRMDTRPSHRLCTACCAASVNDVTMIDRHAVMRTIEIQFLLETVSHGTRASAGFRLGG